MQAGDPTSSKARCPGMKPETFDQSRRTDSVSDGKTLVSKRSILPFRRTSDRFMNYSTFASISDREIWNIDCGLT